jgi:hypothetical protein
MAGELRIVHVQRPPLPWRQQRITECGLPVAGHPVISRDEWVAKVKAQGQQRSKLTTCITCWDTADRWPAWEADPVRAMAREVERWHALHRVSLIRQELTALAALVERHPDEYAELLEDVTATVMLPARRDGRLY